MNRIDKAFIYLICASLFFIGALVLGGGFYSEKYRMFISFGEYSSLVGAFFIGVAAYIFYFVTK